MWRFLCLSITGWVGLLLLWHSMSRAAPLPQAPVVVSPDAVTTPAVPSLLPTVTPTPNATLPLTNSYTIRPGDTLLTVALELGVDLASMPCVIAPDFTPDQPLVIGNALALPPPHLLCHQVVAGETLATIAAQYHLSAEVIHALPWNQLAQQPLTAVLSSGRYLRIPLLPGAASPNHEAPVGLPSGQDFLGWILQQPVNSSPFAILGVGGPNRAVQPQNGPLPANWPYGSGHFAWPLYGWLTQSYRYDHRAIDIAAPVGTLVTASDRGVVIRAGWNNQGYGNFVIIDHNIDYVTLYAHLSEIYVTEGQVIGQGEPLGRVGSTGNSTGPHLHFELRDFGRLTNPLELLGQ